MQTKIDGSKFTEFSGPATLREVDGQNPSLPQVKIIKIEGGKVVEDEAESESPKGVDQNEAENVLNLNEASIKTLHDQLQ